MLEEKNEEQNTVVDDLFKDLDKLDTELNKEIEDKKENLSDDGTKAKEDKTNVESLEQQLKAIQSERHGLLNAAKAERNKRQDIQQNLDSLTSTVNNILQQRQVGKKDDFDNTIEVPVNFSEDGEQAFIKGDKITELLSPLHTKIQQLEKALQTTNVVTEGNRKATELMDVIVNSDDRFGKVYSEYKQARKWVNDQVIDYQRDNNINGVLYSGQVLDKVLNETVETAFKEKFPGFNLIDVATAEDSQRHFKGMLSKSADLFDVLNEKEGDNKSVDDSSKFKQIINKPSGLSSNTNAKGNELSITERAGSLDSSDIMNLSDSQAKQLEEALLREEKADGVKF